MINDFFKHLTTILPLHNTTIEIRLHDAKVVPKSYHKPHMIPSKGLASKKGNKAVIHVATQYTTCTVLDILAHEYRHVWQWDTGSIDEKKREWDAKTFALPTARKYCRANNLPTDFEWYNSHL